MTSLTVGTFGPNVRAYRQPGYTYESGCEVSDLSQLSYLVSQSLKHLRRGQAGNRMTPLGRERVKRDKYEVTPVHPWMWEGEPRRIDYLPAYINKVYIDYPVSVASVRIAMRRRVYLFLKCLKNIQQLYGRTIILGDSEGATYVYKVMVGFKTPWSGDYWLGNPEVLFKPTFQKI